MSVAHRLCGRGPMAAAALVLSLSLPALADDAPAVRVGSLTILAPWARATPGGAEVAATYFTIRNDGDAPDRLIDLSSPVADHASVHEMATKDGVMTMRGVTEGLEIPGHGTVTLKPGGYHVMLEHLKQPLKRGMHFTVALRFARAGTADIDVPVAGVGAQGPDAPAAQ